MSNVVNEKEKKTFTLGAYNVNVVLDDQPFEAITVEGRNPQSAFEKFVRWYTVYRSSFFEGLIYEDVESAADNVVQLKWDKEKEPLVEGKFSVEIPIKQNGEIVSYRNLQGTFYKRFII